MTPFQAGVSMRRVRDLVEAGAMDYRHIAVADLLLFNVRSQNHDQCQVSYATMAMKLHMRRAKLVEIVRDFELHGILQKIRSWAWVRWKGFMVKRQASNIYRFIQHAPKPPKPVKPAKKPCPQPEFPRQTTIQESLFIQPRTSQLERTLASLGATIKERDRRNEEARRQEESS